MITTNHSAILPLTNSHYSSPGIGGPHANNYGHPNQYSGFDNQTQVNWTSASAANFNNKWANNQNQGNKQDWSAFESLLPTANNNQTGDNNSKKLTDNEMMDLLS